MACASNCRTQDHPTYGACLRAKRLQVQDVFTHKFRQNQDKQIDEYVDARREGMQPETIFKKDVDFARKMTDLTGVPYRADKD